MARGVINTRLELDQDMDSKLRKIAVRERRSKKQMAELLIERVIGVDERNPDALRDLQIVRDSR
jgi:predicted transcriptional regulator